MKGVGGLSLFSLCMICAMDKQIEALLIERAGYVARKKPDRVKAVDQALSALGYEIKSAPAEVETASIQPDAERAVRKAAPKRKA